MNPIPAVTLGVHSTLDKTPSNFSEVSGGWQFDHMIGANPMASLNLALMMGVVVGWLIKRR